MARNNTPDAAETSRRNRINHARRKRGQQLKLNVALRVEVKSVTSAAKTDIRQCGTCQRRRESIAK